MTHAVATGMPQRDERVPRDSKHFRPVRRVAVHEPPENRRVPEIRQWTTMARGTLKRSLRCSAASRTRSRSRRFSIASRRRRTGCQTTRPRDGSRFGPNRLPSPSRASALRVLLDQFNSIVVVLLIAAAGISLALGDLLEAVAIGAVLIINTLIGFAMELRARRAMEAILGLDVPIASVVRAGHLRTIPAEGLVPGDVVELAAGRQVPADVRLIEEVDLRLNEAPLTGESLPVSKTAHAILQDDTALADRRNMAYKGTTVAAGLGRGVVTATGVGTEVGRIGALVADVEVQRYSARTAARRAGPASCLADPRGCRARGRTRGMAGRIHQPDAADRHRAGCCRRARSVAGGRHHCARRGHATHGGASRPRTPASGHRIARIDDGDLHRQDTDADLRGDGGRRRVGGRPACPGRTRGRARQRRAMKPSYP